MFSTERTLRLHKDSAHAPKKHLCNQCGRIFQTGGVLDRHIAVEHDKIRYECEACDKSFRTVFQYRKHRRYDHLLDENNEKVEKELFKCDLCDREFDRPNSIKRHMRSVHQKGKHYICEFCSKVFYNGGSYTRHRRVHTNERPYTCIYCITASFKLEVRIPFIVSISCFISPTFTHLRRPISDS